MRTHNASQFCSRRSRKRDNVSSRKSQAEHALCGTEARITSLDESHVAGALPRPPKFLSKEAKKKFRGLTSQLSDRRAVTAGDGDLIAQYCVIDERWQQALAKIRDEGAVRIYLRLDRDGTPVETEKENLHIGIAQTCERQMVVILKQLGLTPKDRETVRPTAPPKRSKELDPNSLEAMQREGDRLRALLAAEQAVAPEPEEEIDINSIDTEVL
jgi:P27 family predicted phage terminase small subunit